MCEKDSDHHLRVYLPNHFVHIRSSAFSVNFTFQLKNRELIIFSKMSVRQLESKDEFVALKAEVSLFLLLTRSEASFLIILMRFM